LCHVFVQGVQLLQTSLRHKYLLLSQRRSASWEIGRCFDPTFRNHHAPASQPEAVFWSYATVCGAAQDQLLTALLICFSNSTSSSAVYLSSTDSLLPVFLPLSTLQYGARLQQAAEEASEDEAAAEAGAGGGLLVQLDASRAGVARGGAAAAAQWFGQDLFEDPNVDVDSDDGDEPQQQQQQQKQQKAAKQKRQQQAQQAAVEEEQEQQQQQQRAAKRHKTGKNGVANGSAGHDSGSDDGSSSDTAASDSDVELDSDEEEFNALDDAGKAEVLALAKKMLRRKDKDSIVEAAYNRCVGAQPAWKSNQGVLSGVERCFKPQCYCLQSIGVCALTRSLGWKVAARAGSHIEYRQAYNYTLCGHIHASNIFCCVAYQCSSGAEGVFGVGVPSCQPASNVLQRDVAFLHGSMLHESYSATADAALMRLLKQRAALLCVCAMLSAQVCLP
jgi:predicted RNA binding protein YcfA (HicA-like mRNA interferase family)